VSGVLAAQKRTRRTTENCDGGLLLTRYVSGKNAPLSELAAAGNQAGKKPKSFPNLLNPFIKLLGFESSPGHKIETVTIHFSFNFAAFQTRIFLARERDSTHSS